MWWGLGLKRQRQRLKRQRQRLKRQIHLDEEMLFVVGLGLIQGGNESDSRQERGGAAKYGLPTLCFVYLTTHPQLGQF